MGAKTEGSNEMSPIEPHGETGTTQAHEGVSEGATEAGVERGSK